MVANQASPYVSVTSFANYTGLSRSGIIDLIGQGKIPATRWGRKWRIHKSALGDSINAASPTE